MKKHLLFICHRIPFPPNKGEKIRSFHILKYLSRGYDVSLVFLYDDLGDARHVNSLNSLVINTLHDYIHPIIKKCLCVPTVVSSLPLSIPYFYSTKLQTDLDQLLDAHPADVVFCSSSPVAEYLFRSRHYHGSLRQATWVMDLIDVDSEKWRQYADNCHWSLNWLFRREARTLLAYEAKIEREFDSILLTSGIEKRLFLSHVSSDKIEAVSNGVDLSFFTPDHKSPLEKSSPVLVFTGAMDYKPNIDGTVWFADQVFPLVRDQFPSVEFFIVGSHPAPVVTRLAGQPGIHVTGFVNDVRDYLALADVCVCPLRIARGIQNKVLEAMAMGKTMVCSLEALQGIKAEAGQEILVAEDADLFAAAICRLLADNDERSRIGNKARQRMEQDYSWERNLCRLDAILNIPHDS